MCLSLIPMTALAAELEDVVYTDSRGNLIVDGEGLDIYIFEVGANVEATKVEVLKALNNGASATTFEPNALPNREQALVIAVRMVKNLDA